MVSSEKQKSIDLLDKNLKIHLRLSNLQIFSLRECQLQSKPQSLANEMNRIEMNSTKQINAQSHS